MVLLIFWVLLGVTLAVIQIMLIRSFIKSLALSGLIFGFIGTYKFWIQPHFDLPLLTPEIALIVGGYAVTKAILWFLRIWYGVI